MDLGVTKPQRQQVFGIGDIVITPSNRRAKLTSRRNDGYWNADYLDAPQFQSANKVILNPKHIRPE